ncbi:hypothetical protein T265_10347 [Opisthorchis viverrini]|uniref:Uncharacterized protein n=1 Tax=Opisthorchis viverrini TaxID=6198 RepID=A0A074Z2K1_OPIVI|nr:hypothetical protein T265_10347 [Opisthorchis viverrini]KER21286.1 hypothetical protein T265_10347 [Opisthorchis viverrini]
MPIVNDALQLSWLSRVRMCKQGKTLNRYLQRYGKVDALPRLFYEEVSANALLCPWASSTGTQAYIHTHGPSVKVS